MNPTPPRIALWFRYGPAEHTELFHAMPQIVAALAARCEVHYFGLQSRRPVPELIRRHAVIHALPFHVRRTSERDKRIKTALWLLALPLIARRCRRLGVRAVYLDETVPLSAPLARAFFGPRVAITVADFFVDIYLAGCAPARLLARLIRRADLAAWRRLPLIFTRARATRDYLAAHGVPAERVHPVYDPCDFSVYRPVAREPARLKFGWRPEDVVLVHHGILHPNKGNDFILRALAPLRDTLPAVRFLLVGDGPDMPRLRALARELGLADRVTFTGWLPHREEVNEALNSADIGLVMRVGRESDHFHVTGALVHAMACGLPVLAARLGGISEAVVDGETGFLFDPRVPGEFQAQLARLAADAGLRRRLGAAAHRRARELFDMDAVTAQTVAPLLRLVEEAP